MNFTKISASALLYHPVKNFLNLFNWRSTFFFFLWIIIENNVWIFFSQFGSFHDETYFVEQKLHVFQGVAKQEYEEKDKDDGEDNSNYVDDDQPRCHNILTT